MSARGLSILLLCVAAGACGCSSAKPAVAPKPAAQATTDAPPARGSLADRTILQEAERAAREQAKQIGDAMVVGDLRHVIAMTHPKVIQAAGGPERMYVQMHQTADQMRADRFEFESVDIGAAYWSDLGGDAWYVLLPQTIFMRTPRTGLVQDGSLLGISEDRGVTWKYVDVSSIDEKLFRRLFPGAPARLPIPSKKPLRERPL